MASGDYTATAILEYTLKLHNKTVESNNEHVLEIRLQVVRYPAVPSLLSRGSFRGADGNITTLIATDPRPLILPHFEAFQTPKLPISTRTHEEKAIYSRKVQGTIDHRARV